MSQTVSILASDPAITDSLGAFLSAHGYDISLTPQQELSEAGQRGDIVILQNLFLLGRIAATRFTLVGTVTDLV